MLPVKRREKILKKLNENGTVEVRELASEFDVSETTIRRDLRELEEEKSIIRDYGGAIRVERASTSFEPPYELKKDEHRIEKQRIGELAASLVKKGETVVFDAGSTTLEVVKALNQDLKLSAVTNDLKVAMEVVNKPSMDLIVLGGKHRKGVYTLQGTLAENAMENFTVNRTFLEVDAIDEEKISNVNTEEIPLKRLMVESGEEVTVVGDHSKFGKSVFASVCDVEEIDSIVTDRVLPEELLEAYEEAGVEVMTP